MRWLPGLLRFLPSSVLRALRHSSLARGFVRSVVLPLFPSTVTVGRGLGKGLRLHRRGALVSYLLGTDEPGVQAALEVLVEPGGVAWDVGANVGFFSLILARLVGSEGRVVAFEPRPAAAALVRENADLNEIDRVTVVQRAIGEASGKATFHLRAQPTASSLVAEAAPTVDSIEVEIAALDDLAEELPAPDFVKIDIEGGEVGALRGMTRLLETAGPVLLVENHGFMSEVQQVLDAAGYVVRVLGDEQALPTAAWNAIAVAVPSARSALLDRVSGVRFRR